MKHSSIVPKNASLYKGKPGPLSVKRKKTDRKIRSCHFSRIR